MAQHRPGAGVELWQDIEPFGVGQLRHAQHGCRDCQIVLSEERDQGGGGWHRLSSRALAERVACDTESRKATRRASVGGSAGMRPRPIRSTSCRQAVWAPKGVAVSADRIVARLSSNRT